MTDNLSEIRKELLCEDRIVSLCKNIGVNSNWDLAYVTIALWLEFGNSSGCISYLENCHGTEMLYESSAEFISRKTSRTLEECRRNKSFWHEVVSCFQEWYLGHEEYVRLYSGQPVMENKPFLCENEKPLLNPEKLTHLLKSLKNSGISLGIATGRNRLEITVPLKSWGIYELFDEKRIVTYDDVQSGEALMKRKGMSVSLVKPAPFCFLKAALGSDFNDEDIVRGNYEITERVIAVGDAGADIFAAQNAGFDFLAVLTGVNGAKARDFFEEKGATYINDSLLDICR